MHLTADLLLAFRYLRPKRTFISVITLLSVLGPVLRVAILIIVTSVMSGFDHDIRQRILGMQAHVHVRPVHAGQIIANPEPLLAKMAEVGIQGAPILEGPVLLQLEGTTQIKMARGILPELERKVTALATTGGFVGRFDAGTRQTVRRSLDINDRCPCLLEWCGDGKVVCDLHC